MRAQYSIIATLIVRKDIHLSDFESKGSMKAKREKNKKKKKDTSIGWPNQIRLSIYIHAFALPHRRDDIQRKFNRVSLKELYASKFHY